MATQRFEFSQEDIAERFADHWEFAQNYLTAIAKHLADYGTEQAVTFSVNRRRLYLSIQSAYQDIARYKNYHQDDPWNDRLDATKRGAYLLKWLTRFKPIEPIMGSDYEPDLSSDNFDIFEIVNELFAIHVIEIHMSHDVDIDIELSEIKRREFIYDLLYRQVNVDGWISILQLLKESAPFAGKIDFLQKL